MRLDDALLARAEHLRHGLPRLATHLQEGEVLLLIEREQLMGRGIGYVDAHLLAQEQGLTMQETGLQ